MPRKPTEPKAAATNGAKTAKPPARRARKSAEPTPAHDHVATRAYFIHLESGGEALDNWLQAERELAVR